MTDHHRQTLSDWHRQLKTLQLPVDGAVKAAALKKLNTDNANAANVAAIVRRDPALCLLLMRKANERLNRSNNETTSLAHTISLLGFPFVVSLIGDSQECDKNPLPSCRATANKSVSVYMPAIRYRPGPSKTRIGLRGNCSGPPFFSTVFIGRCGTSLANS